jgi:carbon storage regulator CsrA
VALALTRTEGQAIILAVDGREIRVEVAKVDGAQVRLAITAPDDVFIWRDEAIDR